MKRLAMGLTSALWLCLALQPGITRAEVPGVSALLEQGRYWQSKGRRDLANQAFRRVLALDPANAEARRGLQGPATAPPSAGKPARAASTTQPQQAARPSPATPAPTQQRNGGSTARAAGYQALESGNLESAARSFERSLAANRHDADALGGLGLVRLRQSRFAEARDLLEQASSLGRASQWAEALGSARFFAGMDEARTALAQGRLAQAQQGAEALVRSGHPDRAAAIELLADIYERQGRYADAADLYRQAGEKGGASGNRLASRAARGRALAAAARGDDVEAEQQFHSGLLLDQQDPWIRYEFARYLLARGRQGDAEGLLRSLSASESADWLYAAALLNQQMGRPAAADALMARIPDGQLTSQMRSFAVGLKMDGAVARARGMAGEGRMADGLAALHRLAATPDIDPARKGTIADALYELGDGEGAAALAQEALAQDMADPAAYEPLVRILARTGRDAEAAAAIERAAQGLGDSAEGQRKLAQMRGAMTAAQADRLRQAGQYAAAFDLLQAAWNAAPGNQDVLSALARLYQSGGMPGQASQTFQMILAQSPRDKGAMMGLIETAGAAGDRALARRTIDQALAAYPQDYEIYLAAARMEQARGDEGAALRYLRQARQIYAAAHGPDTLTAANPFGTASQGNNPFRNQSPPTQAAVNPFVLNGGARLPAMTGGMPRGSVAGGSPFASGVGAANAMGAAMPPQSGFGTDPVLATIQSDIEKLTQESGPRAEMRTGYRQRSGETGLSELKELTGSAEISAPFADGRVKARAEAVVLDAGRPTGSGLARFGRNATAEAQGIVNQQPSDLTQAKSQHASGVALSAGYESALIQIEAGTTPLGFEDTEVTWRAAVSPRLSPHANARLWFERKPVTDSVLSYAGTRDPVTGDFWGQVMRIGGGASLSYDRDGTGLYGDLSYYRYRGDDVRRNRSFQVNAGGYLPFYRGDRSSLTGGINVNYQDYANNQNYFTFGHGGYFSPQSFFSVSFPLRYSFEANRLSINANVAPGYQSYSQDQVALYPTDAARQAQLDAWKRQNSDVRSTYDSLSKTGFALSADGSIYYRINPGTRVGGEIGINTFGNYDEFRSLIGIKQSIGGAP
ncbi:MAG: cellulose synthase subunit BcsC-related outer membrane protein [Sphingobium sp.]